MIQGISGGLCDQNTDIPDSLSACLSDMSQMTPGQHIAHQRRCLRQLRAASRRLAAEDSRVLREAPPTVRAVLSAASPGGLRVSLIKEYMELISHPDAEDLSRDLRAGFPLVGPIPVSPVAPEATVRTAKFPASELPERTSAIATGLINQHRAPPRGPDALAAELEILSQTKEDISQGRMGPLRALGSEGTGPPYTRRFGVTQTSSHGKTKLRCIDDFAQSLLNDSVSVGRRIRMGRISDLVEAARRLKRTHPDTPLHVLKSDFKAAYRSCPILPEHVSLANILVRDPDSGELYVSAQHAMPFGAVSAVYAWDRLGDALTSILQKVFLFPASRYVDDLFMPLWSVHASESRQILLEVISLFGATLAPDKTPEPSRSVPVLGVLVSIHPRLVELSIEESRIEFWLGELARLRDLQGARLHHLALRMAGRLEFASAAAWGAPPRSRFNGLYHLAGGGSWDEDTSGDIDWLAHLMTSSPPVRSLPLFPREDAPLILYTDASGAPRNGLGAVLIDGKRVYWTSSTCPASVLQGLTPRKTQINPLEVVGVLLGLWTFAAHMEGRRLVVLIDNQAALGAVRKGRSSVPDINSLVFACRGLARGCSDDPVFIWVPSELNWADAPSRGVAPPRGDFVPPITPWQTLRLGFS